MPELKIMHKLMLLIGGFAVLFLILTAVGLTALRKFESDAERIVSVARPMNNAAYEMEINAVEAGLRVVKYLNRADPDQRTLIDDDIADFKRAHTVYATLAFTKDQKLLAENTLRSFTTYIGDGDRLLTLKDSFRKLAAEISSDFVFIETTIDAAIKQTGNIQGNNFQAMEQMMILRASAGEALGLLSVFTLNNGAEGLSAVDREMGHIEARLKAYAASHREAETPKALMARFAQAGGRVRQLGQTIAEIDARYSNFVEQRRQLDHMLDEDIQIKTGKYLQSISAEQQSAAERTRTLVIVIIVFWGAMMAGAFLLVSRGIVAPVRKLAEAAEALSAGDFSHRTGLRQRDELGVLAQTFDGMAERLQVAYNRLSESNAGLDARIADRTDELASTNEQLQNELVRRKQTERELRDAIEAANAASESKTLFLGNMSHELRTPLNAIIGFSDVIIHEMFGPVGNAKYADYAKDINQSGVHLLTLINELLDVARIESGKLSLTEEAFDLRLVLETCLHMHSEIASKRQVFLVRNIDGDLPFMFGDHTRVQQIFTNLIGNAVKFTPPEGSVKLSAKRDPAGSLVLSVTDTGIGIAPENIARVFETFGQVANVLTRAHEGAGLGLPLAKLLTERHDGVLEITSEVGLGTTVTVTFPASRVINSRSALKLAVS